MYTNCSILLLLLLLLLTNRGVVLYTMVMGSLPFGDDNQIVNGLANYHHLPMDGKLISEGKSNSILLTLPNHCSYYLFRIRAVGEIAPVC